jgi:hypothetical protein
MPLSPHIVPLPAEPARPSRQSSINRFFSRLKLTENRAGRSNRAHTARPWLLASACRSGASTVSIAGGDYPANVAGSHPVTVNIRRPLSGTSGVSQHDPDSITQAELIRLDGRSDRVAASYSVVLTDIRTVHSGLSYVVPSTSVRRAATKKPPAWSRLLAANRRKNRTASDASRLPSGSKRNYRCARRVSS